MLVVFEIESFEALRVGDGILNDVARHESTGFFGKNADCFVGAIFWLLKDEVKGVVMLGDKSIGVFFRGEIDNELASINCGWENVLPECCDIFHFKPVGFGEVKRPKNAIEPREDAKVFLRELELFFGEGERIE